MKQGSFWFGMSIPVAIGAGFISAWSLRSLGVLPPGWLWWCVSYCLGALVGFVLFGLILTVLGR